MPTKSINKTLFQLYLDPAQKDYIIQMAEKAKCSRAAFVREIIDKHRKRNARKK